MQSASLLENEQERLQALFDYYILDTEPEEAFDQLTQLASSICGTPIALVSLIDESRQWFKSHHGLDATETPREFAFCAHAIHGDTLFEIEDSRKDLRFNDNPLVTDAPEVIFYAGAPLTTPEGQNIGTLCVIDHKPSKLNDVQKQQLSIIAKQVVAQLELRKNNLIKEDIFSKLMSLTKKMGERNVELNAFSSRAAHDLNGPIRQISQLAQFCIEDITANQTNDVKDHCENMITRCGILQTLIRDIFELTRADTISDKRETINFKKLLVLTLNQVEFLMEEKNVTVDYAINIDKTFLSENIRLQQILTNLVSNAIKYANPKQDKKYVNVAIDASDNGVNICVKDNGLGIPLDKQDRVFTMFERFSPDAAEGTGLGLTIVKKHVESLGGNINFTSDDGGTEFRVELPENHLP